jgi:hypothetical protein
MTKEKLLEQEKIKALIPKNDLIIRVYKERNQFKFFPSIELKTTYDLNYGGIITENKKTDKKEIKQKTLEGNGIDFYLVENILNTNFNLSYKEYKERTMLESLSQLPAKTLLVSITPRTESNIDLFGSYKQGEELTFTKSDTSDPLIETLMDDQKLVDLGLDFRKLISFDLFISIESSVYEFELQDLTVQTIVNTNRKRKSLTLIKPEIINIVLNTTAEN